MNKTERTLLLGYSTLIRGKYSLCLLHVLISERGGGGGGGGVIRLITLLIIAPSPWLPRREKNEKVSTLVSVCVRLKLQAPGTMGEPLCFLIE